MGRNHLLTWFLETRENCQAKGTLEVGWGEDPGLRDGIPGLQKQTCLSPFPEALWMPPSTQRTGGGGCALGWPAAATPS